MVSIKPSPGRVRKKTNAWNRVRGIGTYVHYRVREELRKEARHGIRRKIRISLVNIIHKVRDIARLSIYFLRWVGQPIVTKDGKVNPWYPLFVNPLVVGFMKSLSLIYGAIGSLISEYSTLPIDAPYRCMEYLGHGYLNDADAIRIVNTYGLTPSMWNEGYCMILGEGFKRQLLFMTEFVKRGIPSIARSCIRESLKCGSNAPKCLFYCVFTWYHRAIAYTISQLISFCSAQGYGLSYIDKLIGGYYPYYFLSTDVKYRLKICIGEQCGREGERGHRKFHSTPRSP